MKNATTSLFCLLSLVLLCSLVSCKKGKNEVNFYHEYFPLEKGTFVEYQVTHTSVDNDGDLIQTEIYKLKTVVGDTIIDNSGRVARKFYRYKYDDVTAEYKVQDVWVAIIDGERAELVEENQRFIKLVFAPTLSKEWDVNAFNNYDPIYAYYDLIHKPYSVNQMDFDSCLVVKQDSVLNFIEFKHQYEVYSKGIGMIKKVDTQYKIDSGDVTKPLDGDSYTYDILSYGKE